MAKWRRHSREFKQQVVERMKSCDNIRELARELDIERKLLYTWKYQIEGRPEAREREKSQQAASGEEKLRLENRRLKETLADKALEVDFFRGALRRVEAAIQNSESGGRVSTPRSRRRRSGKAE
jgi:transposase-like protein